MPEITILNHQGSIRISGKRVKSLVRFLFREKKVRAGISILFCDDKEIRRFHREFMGLNTVTDVMSFPSDHNRFCDEDYLGDVVVSAERAAKVAARYGQPKIREMERYVVHGILHLLGHDDKTPELKEKMFAVQESILNRFWSEIL